MRRGAFCRRIVVRSSVECASRHYGGTMGEPRNPRRSFVKFTGRKTKHAQRSNPVDVTDVEEDTIRRLCREVSDELEALTERAVQQIRSELPAYSAVPVAEQGNYIRKQLSAMLCAVA